MAGLWGPFIVDSLDALARTSVRVLVGYCLLARALSLAP
jgi:hypothetical protein